MVRSARTLPVAAAACAVACLAAAEGAGPFVDYRGQRPGAVHKITPQDLPAPFATRSAVNDAHVVARPKDAWPQAPAGFKVSLHASGLDNPRLIRTAPNGDVFLAESRTGIVRVFRGVDQDGKAQKSSVYARDLRAHFGIAFYPP